MMELTSSLVALSLFAGSALSAPLVSAPSAPREVIVLEPRVDGTAASPAMKLLPIRNRVVSDTNATRPIVPSRSVNLQWGPSEEESLVEVLLGMANPAVVLEDIDEISTVDCTGNSTVAVTFSTTDAFNEAVSEWRSLNNSFIIITNHMGDCDSELERSFFLADTESLAMLESNLTIIATAEKTDVASTADETEISFASSASGLASAQKRGVKWDQTGLTIEYSLALPENQKIVSTDYITVTANQATVNHSVTYGGYIKWTLLEGLKEFTFDMDKSVSHHTNLTIDVTGKYDDTWTYTPPVLSYAVVDIPGIFSLGPAMSVAIGGELTIAGTVSVDAVFDSSMPNGTVHLDFLNPSNSASSGWSTDHNSTYEISEDVAVTVRPLVDFTVEWACNLFGGLVDLSTGIKAEPSFPVVFTATATQDISAAGNVTFPNATMSNSCGNGLKQTVDFEFEVTAFATEWLDVTLYDYKLPISESCYSALE